MWESERAVELFFELYGSALSAGALDLTVDCWGTPAFVISDLGVRTVSGSSEVEAFFERAVARCRAGGYTSTRPEVVRVERLGQRVFCADVRWSNLAGDGRARSVESWRYILKASKDEHLRIHVAVRTARCSQR